MRIDDIEFGRSGIQPDRQCALAIPLLPKKYKYELLRPGFILPVATCEWRGLKLHKLSWHVTVRGLRGVVLRDQESTAANQFAFIREPQIYGPDTIEHFETYYRPSRVDARECLEGDPLEGDFRQYAFGARWYYILRPEDKDTDETVQMRNQLTPDRMCRALDIGPLYQDETSVSRSIEDWARRGKFTGWIGIGVPAVFVGDERQDMDQIVTTL